MPHKSCNDFLNRFHDKEWEHRFLAAKKLSSPAGLVVFRAFSQLEQAEMTRELILLLEDENSQVRMQAAGALGALGQKEAIEALLTALADPSEWVRVQATEAIGRMGNPFSAKILAQHLETETEPHVRATLVKAMGLIGDETITPTLALYLDDQDSRVRANCVEALTQLKISHVRLREAISKLVNDPSNRVRANVAMSLLATGEDKGREILKEMIASKDEFMRASAAYAFGETGQAEDRPAIVQLLGDPSWMVRRNAVKALCKHGAKALPEVLAATTSADQMMKIGALEVLGELKDPSVRPRIIPLLEDESGDVRSKAEEVLDLLNGF
jgi:HEAT repeat protein